MFSHLIPLCSLEKIPVVASPEDGSGWFLPLIFRSLCRLLPLDVGRASWLTSNEGRSDGISLPRLGLCVGLSLFLSDSDHLLLGKATAGGGTKKRLLWGPGNTPFPARALRWLQTQPHHKFIIAATSESLS